jgi:CO/xanthine dehydrogenase Mo-binding subunit
MGKSELGQGIDTAIAQVVADTLGLRIDQVSIHAPDTTDGPDENFTAGSLSVPHSGTAILLAAAHARQLFTQAACSRLESTQVKLHDGVFTTGTTQVSYWELVDDVSLHVKVDPDVPLPESGENVGASVPRLDLMPKILGAPSYLQDMRLPGMVYGRVVRPAFRGATVQHFDEEDIRNRSEILSIVCDGAFLGIVAESEIAALKAADALSATTTWMGTPNHIDDVAINEFLTTVETEDLVLADGPELSEATLSAEYSRPFLAHASIGPACAIAAWNEDLSELEVWSHTQGVYPLRRDLSRALEVPEAAISVHHVQGAGCYGHNPADDAAFDAAYLARSVPGRPVHVTWSREDELGWGPFGPAMVVRISSTTDPSGLITHWSWDGYGNGHSSRPSTLPSPSLLGYAALTGSPPIPPAGDPPLTTGAGTGRNAIPGYDIGDVRAVAHRALQMPIRSSAMRSLGAHMNVFAIESHLDDLASLHDIDPVEYRLRHLSEPRARAVIEAAAAASEWGTDPGLDCGRGIGYARYKGLGASCAVVAEVEAIEEVRVTGLWIAVDCGRVVNPDGVKNQIEGGAIQALSWTLKERVRFADGSVSSNTWEDYPILRFTDVPPITVQVIDRREHTWLGAGEASMGPTAAAIGNAVHDALDIRVRHLPITADAIIQSMES